MAKVKVLEILRAAEGGMKRHVETLVAGLDQEQYTVLMACSKSQFDQTVLRGYGIAKSYHVDLGDKQDPVALFKSLKALRKIILNEDIGIIHAHGTTCTIMASLAAYGTGKTRLISTLHNFPGGGKGVKRFIYPLLLSKALKSSYHIVFVSEALRQFAQSRWRIPDAKTSVIYNGIDVNYIEAASKIFNQPPPKMEGAPIILCVARLIPEKGVDIFIKAAALLIKKLSTIPTYSKNIFPRFLIAGDGPEGKELKKMPLSLGIERYVEFLGHRDDIYPWMREAEFVVLPSYSEGLGLSLLEAMALKKPVIGTSVGGIPEVVIPNKTGLLVASGNAEALTEAMLYILRNPNLAKRMGEAGYDLASKRFSKDHMITEFQYLLNRIAPM